MRTDSVIIALKDDDYRSLVIGVGALSITMRAELQRKMVEAGIVGERLRHCTHINAQCTMFNLGLAYLSNMNIPSRPTATNTHLPMAISDELATSEKSGQ